MWTAREFIAAHSTSKDFGGWQPAELLVQQGESLRFFPGVQGDGWGLRIFPGVADGAPVAFAITDIWRDHPEPWVQPVWLPARGVGDRVPGAAAVFPVGLDSTFYSPFWQAVWVVDPSADPSRYRRSSDVLNNPGALVPGSLVFCPFMPNDTQIGLVAANNEKPRDPMTGLELKAWGLNHGFLDREPVTYFDLGVGRAPFTGQDLEEAKAYFFVRNGANLPVAAVLPSAPLQHALLRRVNVEVGTASPFVPANRPEVAALVRAVFDELKPTRADSNNFPEYTMRLAEDGACFLAPTFPASCRWLDSAAKLEALPTARRTVTTVQFAAGVMVP